MSKFDELVTTSDLLEVVRALDALRTCCAELARTSLTLGGTEIPQKLEIANSAIDTLLTELERRAGFDDAPKV